MSIQHKKKRKKKRKKKIPSHYADITDDTIYIWYMANSLSSNNFFTNLFVSILLFISLLFVIQVGEFTYILAMPWYRTFIPDQYIISIYFLPILSFVLCEILLKYKYGMSFRVFGRNGLLFAIVFCLIALNSFILQSQIFDIVLSLPKLSIYDFTIFSIDLKIDAISFGFYSLFQDSNGRLFSEIYPVNNIAKFACQSYKFLYNLSVLSLAISVFKSTHKDFEFIGTNKQVIWLLVSFNVTMVFIKCHQVGVFSKYRKERIFDFSDFHKG